MSIVCPQECPQLQQCHDIVVEIVDIADTVDIVDIEDPVDVK